MLFDILNKEAWQKGFDSERDMLKAFKATHEAHIKQLYSAFKDDAPVETLILERSDLVDFLLRQVWEHFFKDQESGLCMIAVGGYGRRELLPYSDIDILFLGTEEAINNNQVKLESLITFLWDTNLDIGHSVRTIDECTEQAKADITITTNLMESRPLCGDQAMHGKLTPKISGESIWPSKDFFKAKWDEQISRHKKFNNTEYNLEPNVKTSPGGLRDIQMIGWVAKRHFGASSIDQLLETGFLTHEEYNIMIRGQSFMLKTRFALHMIAGREEDRLLFEHQIRIAAYFGYKDNTGNLAVEQLMKQYFRWALALSELNDMLMLFFDETIIRACEAEEVMELNPRFRVRNGHIEASNEKVFQQTPYALLEIFVLMAQYEFIVGVRASTIRLIRENRHLIDDDFRADPKNKQLFIDLLRSPDYVATQLKLMQRYGILGKYIPAFGEIIGQSQHDLFHIYTVDAHTLLVLKNARRFSYEDLREQFPILTQVMKKMEKKDLLYIACLFHDIAKGRGGNHSELGAVDGYEFCRSHGYSKRDSKLVSWLIKKHLLMSYTSQKKDLSDPDVIRDFALKVGDQLHLDYLFALTVADINGTNPSLWTSWRASLIRQLYYETKQVFRRGLENIVDKQEIIEEKQYYAMAKLEHANVDPAVVELIWSNAADDYFISETANDIAWHTEAISKHMDSDKPLTLIREATDMIFNGATQIFIQTKNKSETFAIVAAVLEQLFLSIVDARIYSTRSGYTMDTFLVLDANGEPLELTDKRASEIRRTLEEKLMSDGDFESNFKRHTPRQLKFFSIPTSTTITHNEEKGYSILEVVSADRPGLLAIIGDIFLEYDINLINAKISTLGERVEDVFYISDQNHLPIYDNMLCTRIQNAIRYRLDEQVAESSQI